MKNKHFITLTLLFFYISISTALASGHIVVSNVVASQEGNWIVIKYDLSHSGDGEIFIELEFAANGTDFTVVSPKTERIDGDINIVDPGTGKEIRWQAAAALAGQFSDSAKTRVKADYRFIGVAGHPGVILDKTSGLMWPQNALMTKGVKTIDDNGLRNWNDAKKWVEDMNSGINANFGFTDWVMPSIAQLRTLYYSKDKVNGPPGHPFINYFSEYWYWTCYYYQGSYYRYDPLENPSDPQSTGTIDKIWAVRSTD
jgi:hypothetical protein